MAWSPKQIQLAKIAWKTTGLNDEQYHIILTNVAGIWKEGGKLSSTNNSANNAGFERFMAYCEKYGFVDRVHGAHHWQQCAARQCDRMYAKIEALWAEGVQLKLVSQDGLPGYVQRMTTERPDEQGGCTRELHALDAEYCFRVLEGLKAWLRRDARKNGVRLSFH